MKTTKNIVILSAIWTVLALCTLFVIIQKSNGYQIAAFAWLGGIITCSLYSRIYKLLGGKDGKRIRN